MRSFNLPLASLLLVIMITMIFGSSTPAVAQSDDTMIVDEVFDNQVLEFYQEDQVVIRDSTFRNTTLSFIEVDNIVIENSRFENIPNIAITIFRAQNTTISNNIFTNIRESAISLFDSQNSIISGNAIDLISEEPGPFSLYVGIQVERSPKTTIRDNEVHSPIGDGIYLFYSPQSVISNNVVQGSGFYALSVSNSDGVEVSNNEFLQSSSFIKNNNGDDIPQSGSVSVTDTKDLVFTVNEVISSDGFGLYLQSITDGYIGDSVISNHETGIFIGLSSNVTLVDMEITDVRTEIEIHESTDIFRINRGATETLYQSETGQATATMLAQILVLISLVPIRSKLRKSQQ